MTKQLEYLTKLTPNQLAATTYNGKRLMIVAGAGTGKTTVITSRIAWLIEQGVKPENILALTFTDKAAREMEERVDQLLPYGVFGTTICTFHSLGQRLLQQYGNYCSVDDQTRVMTEIEQKLMLKENIMKLPLSKLRPLSNPYTSIDPMVSFFSRCKDNLITPEDLLKISRQRPAPDGAGHARNDKNGAQDDTDGDEGGELAEAYAYYQNLLIDKNILDFGELQLRLYQVLKTYPKVLAKIQKQYQYILVDEYQDTNHAQVELIKLLAGESSSLTVVGDDDQSIYRFRGAEVGQMEKFREYYKDCQIITLNDNFRSLQYILDNAYAIIQKNNPHRLESSAGISKKLVSAISQQGAGNSSSEKIPHPISLLRTLPSLHYGGQARLRKGTASHPLPEGEGRGEGSSKLPSIQNSVFGIPVFSFLTDSDEANWIVTDIIERINTGTASEDHCILTRSNMQSRIFSQLLAESNIEYTTKAESNITDDPIVKLMIQYLNIAVNPNDYLSLFMLATSQIYNLKSVDLISHLAEVKETHQHLESLITDIKGSQVLIDDIKTAREVIHQQKTTTLLANFIQKHQVLIKLADLYPGEANRADSGIMKLMGVLQAFEAATSDNSALHFMEERELLLSNVESDAGFGGGGVRLLTVHQAKGLEFNTVYITNLIEGRFPSVDRRSGFDIPPQLLAAKEVEGEAEREERRLMYVAMTRAKAELILTYARRYGAGVKDRKPSRFLSEILPHETAAQAPDTSALAKTQSANHLQSSKPCVDVKTINAHGFDAYLDCPFCYKLAYIDKIPQPETAAAIVGRIMHDVFAYYFNERNSGHALTFNELVKYFDSKWTARKFASKEMELARKVELTKQLEHFHQRFSNIDAHFLPEQSFKVPAGKLKLTGRFDLVIENGNGASIYDFKTSSSIHNAEDAADAAKKSNQIKLYAYAWRAMHQHIPNMQLYFPNKDVLHEQNLTDKDLEKIEEKLFVVIDKICAGNFDATPNSHVCSFCPYVDICPYANKNG